MSLSFRPLDIGCWEDFEKLFGERGACGGCWCMFWRLPRKVFEEWKGEGNRNAMRELVFAGSNPGILAFLQGAAVGWCSLAPRDDFPALKRSRLFRLAGSGENCWSVSCLFVDRRYRARGISVSLLEAACDFAFSRGAQRLEGYPVDVGKGKRIAPAFAWTGTAAAFLKAGFSEVARPAPTRPLMRREPS
jgi:GNAT superfamily N-acetyltransferase